MNRKIVRTLGYALLASGLGVGLASAQTTPAGAAPNPNFRAASAPAPAQSAPPAAQNPQLFLPGLAPGLDKNLVVIMPCAPPPFILAAKGGEARIFGKGKGPLSGGALVALGGYDR